MCSNFFKQSIQVIFRLLLKKWLLLWESPSPALHPAGCSGWHQFLNLVGETKGYGLLELGLTPELNINRDS